jgi:protein TonB
VLIPLAHISGWSSTPPRYSMQRGGAASPSLRASLAAPGNAEDLDETQAAISALPPAARLVQEPLPLPKPKLTVLPEAKVLARLDSQAAPRRDGVATSKKCASSPLKKSVSIGLGATASPPHATAVSVSSVSDASKASKAIGRADRAARPQPSRGVASHGRGSTGSDAFSSAGSAGNRGGGRADQAPSAVASNPVPPYPPDALARGIEGLVLLRVRIGADGSVEEAAIEQSSGTPSLDESALSTVRHRWRFEPATRCGAAVSYEALLPIRFTIRTG